MEIVYWDMFVCINVCVTDRETKIVSRANAHLQSTAQRFNDEGALTQACFATLLEDVVDHESRAAKTCDRHMESAVESFVSIRSTFEDEIETRKSQDVTLLETVLQTQQLLQKTVLGSYCTDRLTTSSHVFALPLL